MLAAPNHSGAGPTRASNIEPRRPSPCALAALYFAPAATLILLSFFEIKESGERGIPSYALEVGCDHCAADKPLRLCPASILELALRPQVRVRQPVAARAALVYDSGIKPWALQFTSSAAGTFRLRASVAALSALRPGVREMVILIGSPREVFSKDLNQALENSALQIFRVPIEYVP